MEGSTPLLQKRKRADYGVDAPDVLWRLFAVLVLAAAMSATLQVLLAKGTLHGDTVAAIAITGYYTAGALIVTMGLMVFSSYVLKRRMASRLAALANAHLAPRTDLTAMRGLDVGCGRGFLLNHMVKALPQSEWCGIDLYDSMAQSGNAVEVTLANAAAEGVTASAQQGDAQQIPFEAASFDVLASMLVYHRVPDKALAARELYRVARPGALVCIGQLFWAANRLKKALVDAGFVDVRSTGPHFLDSYPPMVVVIAVKPQE